MRQVKKQDFWKEYFEEAIPGILFFSAVFLVIIFLSPGFINILNSNVVSYMDLGFLAIAEVFVLSCGDVDLSAGAGLTLVNVVTVYTYTSMGVGSPLLILFPLAMGLAIGAINGFIVGYLRLNAFLATIGTSFVWSGAALLVLHSPGGDIPTWYSSTFDKGILGIPISIYLILLPIVIWLLFRFLPISNYFYATGDDIKSAFATGINANRMKFYAFILNGLMIGIAGIIYTGATGSGNPLGVSLALPAILAALIGGAAFSGGSGNAIGAVGGALGLGFLKRIIYYLGISSYSRDLVYGIIVLIAIVALSYLKKKKIWIWE